MKKLIVLAAAAMFFAGAGSLQAQCTEGQKKACCASKATMAELKSVTRGELTEMLQAGNVTVVDARSADAYQAGHIEGAVNIAAGATLPEDKNATLVFYCGGQKCPLAEQAAKKAMASGYKNVRVFRGGWAEWQNS